MKRSRAPIQLAVVALVALDTLTRLAAPAALLNLTRGWAGLAAVAAGVVAAVGVVRSLLVGLIAERREVELWSEIVAAISATSVVDLKARGDDERTWRLVDAAQRVVDLETTIAPRLAANGIALAASVVAAWLWLGPAWLALGAAGLAVIALVVVPGQRGIRRAQNTSHRHLTDVGADLDVLLEASAEIRVHGRERAVAIDLEAHAERSARARRRAQFLSALVGLLPLSIVLLGLTMPPALGITAVESPDVAPLLARAGVIAGAGFVFALGMARGLESYAHAAPQRRMLAALLAAGGHTTSPTSQCDPDGISLEAVGITYGGAERATPRAVSFDWPRKTGVVLVGDNGSGKTTLAQSLIGLVEVSSGAFRLDGTVATLADLASLRAHAVYLPQTPYVAPERTVAWHLDLVAGGATDEAQRRALDEVGLLHILNRHAPQAPLEVRVGQLSGGERRRLALSRLFLTRPAEPWLYILDEPEAGLDGEGRSWLRAHLATLATRARVLLVAHDLTLVPEGFLVVDCKAGDAHK